jgi:hypothetical protein
MNTGLGTEWNPCMPLVPRFREFKQPHGTVHWALIQAMALPLTAAAAFRRAHALSNQCRKDPESVFLAVSRMVRSCKETRVNDSASLVSKPRDGQTLGCAQPCMPTLQAQAVLCVFRTSHVSSGRYGTTRPTIIQQLALRQPALASGKQQASSSRSELLLVVRLPGLQEGLLGKRRNDPAHMICLYLLHAARYQRPTPG